MELTSTEELAFTLGIMHVCNKYRKLVGTDCGKFSASDVSNFCYMEAHELDSKEVQKAFNELHKEYIADNC